MAKKSQNSSWKSLNIIFFIAVLVLLLSAFIFWRIDNPRTEVMRSKIIDILLPVFWPITYPVKISSDILRNFETYSSLIKKNKELRRDLQDMMGWKEKAIQLEQKNAQLRALNNVKLNARLTWVTGEIVADSGSPFYQSGVINIGSVDGLNDGSAAVDGLGLVGRVSGLGKTSARVLFLTDISSAIPVIIKPANQKGILRGNNSPWPTLEFVEKTSLIKSGDRVYTSGDGNVFPSDILVGNIFADKDKKIRVRPVAKFDNLEFLRILRPRNINFSWSEQNLVGMENF